MSGVLIIGAGSCIIEAILNHFRTIPGLQDKAEFYLSQILADGRAPIPADVLGRCNILIEEAAPWQNSGTLSAEESASLPESCTRITVPTLHFNSFWPLMTEDPRNVPEPGEPYGRIPFGVGDRVALKIIKTVTDPGLRRAAYDAVDLTSVVKLARSHELEVRNCFAREQGCDVRVAGFVMSNFREKRLYYTHNHPTGELMYFVLAQLFGLPVLRDLIRLPYDQLVTGARQWADTSNVFAGEEAPVHPAVAEHFGLRWWRRDHRYLWRGEGYTFDQWIDWYLSYLPNTGAELGKALPSETIQPFGRELPIGPYLVPLIEAGGAEQVTVLQDASVVARARPFFTTAVDPDLAPHAGQFSGENAQSYEVGDIPVGSLAHATVLGSEGLVLHEGSFLGDTVRHLTVGADAPIVEAIQGDRLTLMALAGDALAEKAVRRITGRAFCGFAASWQDDGHWLLTTLPRLVAWLELRARIPALKLILPPLSAGSFQMATLHALGIAPADAIQIGVTEAITCDELLVTSAFDLWRVAPFCRRAAQVLTAKVQAASLRPITGPTHVFLRAPGDIDKVSNMTEVAAALAGRGFVQLVPQELSLADRVAALANARHIVGIHGPALTALLFAPEHAQVLEVFGPADPQPLYWSIASVAKLQYGYVVGDRSPAFGEEKPRSKHSFELKLALLERALDRMLGPQLSAPNGMREPASVDFGIESEWGRLDARFGIPEAGGVEIL